MQVIKLNRTVAVYIGKLSVTFGVISGFYVGFQIDKQHVSLDFGLVYIDVYW